VKVKDGIKEFIKVKKDSYPELTEESVFVNVPKVFSVVWGTFKYVVPERTRRKIKIFQSKRESLLYLLSRIPPGGLDESFGGLHNCPVKLSDFGIVSRGETLLRGEGIDTNDSMGITGGEDMYKILRGRQGEYEVINTAEVNKFRIDFEDIGNDNTTDDERLKQSKKISKWRIPTTWDKSGRIASWEYRVIRLRDGVDVTSTICDASLRVVEDPSLGEVKEIDFYQREVSERLRSR